MSGWGSIYNDVLYSLRLRSTELASLQEQATTGCRVLRASDDPAAAYRILHLRGQSLSLENYQANLQGLLDRMDQAYNALSQVSTRLTTAQQWLTQAATATYDDSQRQVHAEGFDGLLRDILMQANSTYLGQYVFSGTSVKVAPYAAVYDGDQIVAVNYQGSGDDLPVPVAPGVEYTGMTVGDRIFRSQGRSDPQFVGNAATGARAGSGTSSARGDVWLAVAHEATWYEDAGASGVAAGADSSTGDTILGTGHTLTIDADARTVALDGGAAVAFTGTENNLRVTNSLGDAAYLDLTGLDPGLSGTVVVPIRATARLSIDDGAGATVVADFTAANVAVEDSRTGKVLFVDPRALARTGLEYVRIAGTYDVFATLIEIRDMLRNERNLPREEQLAALRTMMDSLEEVSAGVTQSLTSLGTRTQAMDALKGNLEDLRSAADTRAAAQQDADIVLVATELARSQTLYQMSLLTASKMLSLSLLDYV